MLKNPKDYGNLKKLGNYRTAKQKQMKQNLSKQKFFLMWKKFPHHQLIKEKSAQGKSQAKATRNEKISIAFFEGKEKYFETSRRSNKISVNLVKENAMHSNNVKTVPCLLNCSIRVIELRKNISFHLKIRKKTIIF